MTKVFRSKLTRGGSLILPEIISVDKSGIKYSRRNSFLIGKDEIFLPFYRISSVSIDRQFIGATLTINGIGNEKIVVSKLSWRDASQIRILIEQNISN